MMMTALLMLSTADANAQGFLKKLKQKAQQAVLGNQENRKDSQDEQQTDSDEPADASKLSVAQGSDIVPKRKTVTITWDGVITPSKSSSATALIMPNTTGICRILPNLIRPKRRDEHGESK